jgi:hypothetical protein
LGRVYKTTATHLDSIRNYFTFDSEAILTYRVGCYDQMATKIIYPNPLLPTSQDYQRQEATLTKVQQLCLLFKEKLESLEEKISSFDDESPDESQNSLKSKGKTIKFEDF